MNGGGFLHIWTPLCTHSALQWTFIMATLIDQLSHHHLHALALALALAVALVLALALACIQTIALPYYLEANIWEIVRFEENGPQKEKKMQISFKIKGQQEQKRMKWTVLLRDTEELLESPINLFSLSFHAGLSQINNLCNIFTVCSFKQPHGNWHLNHYCIKVIFVAVPAGVCVVYGLVTLVADKFRGVLWICNICYSQTGTLKSTCSYWIFSALFLFTHFYLLHFLWKGSLQLEQCVGTSWETEGAFLHNLHLTWLWVSDIMFHSCVEKSWSLSGWSLNVLTGPVLVLQLLPQMNWLVVRDER